MFGRVSAIAMNTYREAVRARVLFGLLALALATSAYSLVIAAMSLRQEMRIVADIGAASMSFYAVVVSVILGATSLYRELELKTIFPILTRRLRRHEYVVGKYLGNTPRFSCSSRSMAPRCSRSWRSSPGDTSGSPSASARA